MPKRMESIFREQNRQEQKQEGPVFSRQSVNTALSPEAVGAVPLWPLERIPPSAGSGAVAAARFARQSSSAPRPAHLLRKAALSSPFACRV